METDQAFRIFLSFVYPELKSFSLNFLTLVSGVLAFSVTFADKVLGITGGFSRRHLPLSGAWSMFLCSIALTGYGLWRLFGAAEVAQGCRSSGTGPR